MAAVLFRIGSGVDDIGVLARLLNPAVRGQKPAYTMARDFPLVLHEVTCDGTSWRVTRDANVVHSLAAHAESLAIRAALLDGMVDGLLRESPSLQSEHVVR
jgi:hypothetical protein